MMNTTNNMFNAINFLLPDSYYPHDMQAEMLAANVRTPIFTKGLDKFLGYDVPSAGMVYVASFGGKTLRHIYEATGGNPLASFNRDNLCLVITPTLSKFSYSKTVHGAPLKVRDMLTEEECSDMTDEELDDIIGVEPGHLPSGFRQNALEVERIALKTIEDATCGQPFTVVGSKLSPLTSGKGNIAIFVYFPHGCPFKKQEFLDSGEYDCEMNRNIKIRVIPRPVISPFDDDMCGVKFDIKFIDIDNKLFEMAFPLLQHAIATTFEGSNLRFIKPNMATKELTGLIQVNDEVDESAFKEFERAIAKINFQPYVFVSVSLRNVVIE